MRTAPSRSGSASLAGDTIDAALTGRVADLGVLANGTTGVADLEAKQAELTTELADPATYSQGAKIQQLNADLKATTDALHAASADWEKAAQKLTDAKGA